MLRRRREDDRLAALRLARAARPERRPDRRVAGPLVQRTRLAEGRDAGHHEARIDRVQCLPAETPALQDTRAEVFENDVAVRDQPANDVLSLRQMQIERHELLVAVVDREPVRAAVLGRPQAPQVVTAAGYLGLDHLGAELGHQRAAEWAGDHLGELEHPDSVEWAARLCHGAAVYLFGPASAIGAQRASAPP